MIKEDGLPVGLGFGLAMNEKALGQFSMMTEDEKRQDRKSTRLNSSHRSQSRMPSSA